MNSFLESWGPGAFDTSWWHMVGWTMCYFLIAGSAVAGVGAILRFLCRRAAPSVRYSVSLAVFATLALMPIAIAAWLIAAAPPIAQSSWLETNAPSEAVFPEATPPETSTPTPPILTQSPRQDDGAMVIVRRAIGYLPWLWIFGAPITFALLATGLVGSVRLRRKCVPVATGAVADVFSRLRNSLRITHQVGVVVCDRIAQPVLVGIVRPLILLPPAALTGWSPDELEMVLLHELAHVRRYDNLVNLLQRIVESVLFFHPAIWTVSRQVRRDREECCDAVVVAHTAKPQAYAELLVNIAAQGSSTPALAAASALADHPLTGRIRRILKLEDEPMLVSRNTLGIFTLAVVALIAAVLWQPTTTSLAEEPVASEGVTTENTEQDLLTAEVAESAEVEGNPVFLSLEQQRAADLALKGLGVELAQLGVEELARVKANKFEGGLLIAGGGGRNFGGGGLINNGDLLVGLHVWPTKSLEDVAKILQRDDIAELSPLKFFVIRRQPATNPKGGMGGMGVGGYGSGMGMYTPAPEMVDKLITGRVVVNLDAIKKKPTAATPTASRFGDDPFGTRKHDSDDHKPQKIVPGDELLVQVEGEFPDYPIDDAYRVEPTGTLALGPTYGRVEVVGKTLSEAEKAVVEHLRKTLSDVAVQITWAGVKSKSTTLPYDGKTFGQWRQMWKTELKTEKRTECINALAAFGRAGRGKEAVEAILDVAGEYDFSEVFDNPEGRLKSGVLKVFSQQLPASLWLPSLLDRYNTDKEKWEHLAFLLLKRPTVPDDQTRQQLLSIANSDHGLRLHATLALLRNDPKLERPGTVEVVRKALQGEHPDKEVLQLLRYRHLDRVPEQFDLLFHKDLETRSFARNVLSNNSAGLPVFEKLMQILDDPAQSKKHVYAVRAFPYVGGYPNNGCLEALVHIIRIGDEQLLGPALAALEKMEQGTSQNVIRNLLKDDGLSEDRKKLLNDTKAIEKLIQQENRLMKP